MSPEVQQLLNNSGLFGAIPDTIKEALLEAARPLQVVSGEILYCRGDQPRGLYGVLNGQLKLTADNANGKSLLFGSIEAGWWCGEIPALDGQSYSQTATASMTSRLLLIPRQALQQVLQQHPELYKHFTEVLCRRLRIAGRMLEEAAFYDLSTRVACQLLRLYRPDKNPDTVRITLSQEELATMFGVTRQSIHRILKHWQQEGWIEVSYGSLAILQANALRELVQAREMAITQS